ASLSSRRMRGHSPTADRTSSFSFALTMRTSPRYNRSRATEPPMNADKFKANRSPALAFVLSAFICGKFLLSAEHARGVERGDFVRLHPEKLPQHLVRMLAHQRRRAAYPRRRRGKAHGTGYRAHLAQPRVIHGDERVARLHLRVLGDLAYIVDGADRYVVLQQQRLPFLVATRKENLLQNRDQRAAVFHPAGRGAIARVVRQLGAADYRAELAP